MKFPKEVTVELTGEELLKDMDGYDPDSYNEDSVDWLDVEIGNSMETLEVESMEELHDLMITDYSSYVLSDDEDISDYEHWKTENEL